METSPQWAILKTFSNEPLKQKTTMKKNSFLWAALSMTAALVMTACSNDDNANESPVQQSTVKTIPYSVTVNEGATTRATVESDNKTLKFAVGDKLYISGTDIQGVLDIQTGTGTTFSTFSGYLTYSGSGTPASELSLTATLVSAQQNVGTEVSVDAAGAVTVNYPTTSYCGDVATAVQKYSNLTGTSTYGLKSFELTQQTAFLNFVITFEDGTTTGTGLSAVVSNNSAAICTANVTTTTESENVVAKFVLPVASGTTLSSANVKFGDKAAISFGASQTLDGKVYNVTKTQAAAATPTLSLTNPTVGQVIGSDGKNYPAASVPSGVTKVAMIAYVSGSNGLAIALADEGSLNWETAVTTAAAHTPVFSNGTWKLPSEDEWKQMFSANGGDNTECTGLNTAITTAGGTTLQESTIYWSSSVANPGVDAYGVHLFGGNTHWYTVDENSNQRVRACLAF